ncbi:MAG TPA: DUF1800 family protein [Rudaea sp.]|nr:DUF1800 family protein [Rudaea sp.]
MHRRIAFALTFAVVATTRVFASLSHFPDAMFHDGMEGAAAGPFTDADAARFIAQATFGATTADIAHLRQIGYTAWLNEQFAAMPSTEVSYLDWVRTGGQDYINDDARLEIWAANAAGTGDPSRSGFPANARNDQLRQRVAFALSEIFVVSNSNGTLAYEPWCLASYDELLADDAFVNYRTLLEDVTRHPAMGIFLSSIQNMKADAAANTHPDQNYAREVMQLFSVGLVQLNLDGTPSAGDAPTYSQATVEGFAAVFTGWDWDDPRCQDAYENCGPSTDDDPIWRLPMQPVDAFHDDTSDKQLLNYTGVALAGGLLAHGGNTQTELTQALDNVFHHPNVGPFVATRLIRRLVTSNPTPAYVSRVATIFNDDRSAQHVRGNLRAVVQAILLDPEARYGQWQNPTVFGKLREPIVKLVHLWRSMNATSVSGRVNGLTPYPPIEEQIGEAPLRSPTVFNFFVPNYQQSGEVLSRGLFSPEFQILTDSLAVATPNLLYHQVFCNYTGSEDCYGSDDDGTLQIAAPADASLAMSNPSALIDKYNLLFMSGQMSPFMKSILLNRLNAITDGNRGASTGTFRVQHALYLILNSPEYSVQK